MSRKRPTPTPPSEQAQQFGDTIRRLREAAGLGVTQAAARCLISNPYWYQLEAGGQLQPNGERRPLQVAPGILLLIAWQLPVTDPADQEELFRLGGHPELNRRAISLPRVEELGSGADYTDDELRAIEDRAARIRFRREEHGRARRRG